MSLSHALAAAGGVLEVGGVLLTGWDLVRTEHGLWPSRWPERRRRIAAWFGRRWRTVRVGASRVRDGVRNAYAWFLRSVLRRPRPQPAIIKVGGAGSTVSVGSNLTLGYEMKLRAPPDDDAPIEEWLAWLRDRSDDVERRLARRIDQSSGVQADQSQQLDVIRTALDKQEALTSGSIRLQWPGVMMFGIGAILSTASNLV